MEKIKEVRKMIFKSKKWGSLLLIIIFLVLSFIAFPNKTQAAYTEASMKQKLLEIYWDGTVVNTTNWTFNENSGLYSGTECYGFANAVGYYLYGSHQNSNPYNSEYPNNPSWLITTNIDELCVGDTIRYNNYYGVNHSLVVVNETRDGKIYVADANWDCCDGVRWGVEFTRQEILEFISRPLVYQEKGYLDYGYFCHYTGNNLKYLDEPEPTLPTINSFFINTTSTTADTITVRLTTTNADSVKVKIWKAGLSDNSGTTKDATNKGSYWEVKFSKSDVKSTLDNVVCMHATASNSSGSVGQYFAENFVFPTKVTGLGTFKARITLKANNEYCIGVSGNGTGNGDDLVLQTKDSNNACQIWEITELSNGFYKIINTKTGKSMDIDAAGDANGTLVQQWSWADVDQQKFMIQEYNGAYRIVPLHTGLLRAVDVKNGTIQNNQPLWIYTTDKMYNWAQTWVFEKVTTNITLSNTSLNIVKGEQATLTATTTPAGSGLAWSSNKTSVATVDRYGNVVGKSAGTATITVKTTDGSNISKTCTVTVSEAPSGTKLQLNKSTYQFNRLNEVFALRATLSNGKTAAVTWSSDNTTVAVVDEFGNVTALRGGFVNITATSSSFGKAKCWMYVCSPVTLSDGKKAYCGDADRNGTFDANDSAEILEWFKIENKSSDAKLLGDINGDGIIDADDSALILEIFRTECFKCGNETSIHKVYISSGTASVVIGESVKLYGGTVPSRNATETPKLTWSSSNTSIATVDSSGSVRGVKAGTVTITAKYGTLSATCKVTVEEKLPFTDVQTNHWGYSSINYVYKKNLMSGYSGDKAGKFGPEDAINRSQIVSILWRDAGSPESTFAMNFRDVKDTSVWYYKAVRWANENGIVTGYAGEKAGLFGPDDNITREQFALILQRYAAYKGKNSTTQGNISGFSDSSKVSDWALNGIKWAIGTGIITGKADGRIDPQGKATRAEAALMIMRFLEQV